MEVQQMEQKQNRVWVIIALLVVTCTLFLLHRQSNEANQIKQHQLDLKLNSTNLELPQLATGKLKKSEKWSVSRGIKLAREYQLKLNETFFSNRLSAINVYLTKFNSLLNTNLTLENSNEEIREVTLYFPQRTCFEPRFQLRLRKYLSGNKENTSTVDIKYGIDFPPPFVDENVFALPFAPSPVFSSESVLQKYETDVHPCKLKISRETRIYNLKPTTDFRSCEQMLKLFPNIAINETSLKKPIIKLNNEQLWYSVDFYLDNYQIPQSHFNFSEVQPVNIEVNFQIGVYHSIVDAFSHDGKFEGSGSEFSFRIWSPSNGTDAFSFPIIAFFQYVYEEMLIEFSSTEIPCAERNLDVDLDLLPLPPP